MEKHLNILLKDGAVIHGDLWSPYRSVRNKPVVLIVHGMAGNRYESMLRNTAVALYKAGIASLRISLYSWEPGARSFSKCSLATHAQDINCVYEHLVSERVSKIIGIGHSLGFPSLLASEVGNLSGLISWDGTTQDDLCNSPEVKYVAGTRRAYLPWGLEILVDRDMLKPKLPRSFTNYADRIALMNGSVLFIAAGKGVLKKSIMQESKNYARSRVTVIKGADHNFTQIGCEEKLLQETVNFCLKEFGSSKRLKER